MTASVEVVVNAKKRTASLMPDCTQESSTFAAHLSRRVMAEFSSGLGLPGQGKFFCVKFEVFVATHYTPRRVVSGGGLWGSKSYGAKSGNAGFPGPGVQESLHTRFRGAGGESGNRVSLKWARPQPAAARHRGSQTDIARPRRLSGYSGKAGAAAQAS